MSYLNQMWRRWQLRRDTQDNTVTEEEQLWWLQAEASHSFPNPSPNQ